MLSRQAKLVLNVIKSHGSSGVHPTTLIFEAGATQPNARIYDIREHFRCTHKHSDFCCASEHIINKRHPNGTTVYFYENTTRDWEKERQEDLNKNTDPQMGLF